MWKSVPTEIITATKPGENELEGNCCKLQKKETRERLWESVCNTLQQRTKKNQWEEIELQVKSTYGCDVDCFWYQRSGGGSWRCWCWWRWGRIGTHSRLIRCWQHTDSSNTFGACNFLVSNCSDRIGRVGRTYGRLIRIRCTIHETLLRQVIIRITNITIPRYSKDKQVKFKESHFTSIQS